MREFEYRLDMLLRRQHEILRLAAEVSANARQQTRALQFEDVESRVVVYSKDQARRLKLRVAQIEARQQALEADIANGQVELRTLAEAMKNQLAALPRDSVYPGFSNETNSLDRA